MTAAANLQAPWAAALFDPTLPAPGGLRARSGVDAAGRFDVHRNNVVASLVNVLADTFPVVRALVGEVFFRAMAARFVRACPPRDPVLHHYGAGLPSFIAEFAPCASLPYLADVARLEWARMEACHAADAPPLSTAPDPGSDPGALRPLLHPAVRLVASPWAIVSLWAAHQHDSEPQELPLHPAEHALVVRPNLEVLVLRCDAGTAAFVQGVQQGATLADCALAGAQEPGFDLAACLALLLGEGALVALATAQGRPR
ncbi:MAG TPA: DNA-binding domain-containing protein [Ramlibacter sp.]|jgi:hypothetical protein|nr:DNA-binding domain-containing protein [Ramlibacter sp.]